MTRQDCVNIIDDAYRQFVPRRVLTESVGEDTRLFGADSLLDSTALVSLIVEVEQQLSENYGIDLVIADDRAMSQVHSPFRTIASLADYIETILKGSREE